VALFTFCLLIKFDMVVVVLPDTFRRMGASRNSTETQQSGHAPRSGPEVKMEKVMPKMPRRSLIPLLYTDVARNFDWEGSKWKKIVTYSNDATKMTLNWFCKVRYRHNQFKKSQLGQIT